MVQRADYRHYLDRFRQLPEDRQEGEQRHDGIEEPATQRFHDEGETAGIFLDALACAFDMAQARPPGHIKVVHGVAPAEDPMLREKAQQNGDDDVNSCDAREGEYQRIELFNGHAARFAQCFLDSVVELAEPLVD